MVSPTVNVVRYSALFFGVFFGFIHRPTLQAIHDEQKLQHAIHSREHLVAEAKEAWKRQKASPDVITDPEDPRFDLEKLIAKWEATS